ncbi:hypothetical protein LguiA_015645 [Lonicera macranthoides]
MRTILILMRVLEISPNLTVAASQRLSFRKAKTFEKSKGGIPTSLRTIGTKHLRNSPHPIHTVSVKRMPKKDMPGWGFNVPNLEEWEALELAFED